MKGRRTGGSKKHLFQPGNCANPKGRPKIPKDLKKAKGLNKTEFEATLNKYLKSTKEELRKAYEDPETKAADLIVISIVKFAIANGDPRRFEFLLERLLGKVETKVEFNGSIHSGILDLIDKYGDN